MFHRSPRNRNLLSLNNDPFHLRKGNSRLKILFKKNIHSDALKSNVSGTLNDD